MDVRDLIPPWPVVQERLARNYREARLLRRLLRLATDAAREQHRQPAAPQPEARPEGVAS